MKSYIFLNELKCFAYHGVGEQEQQVGNEFTIDLKLKVDISAAMQSDEVSDTVSYADVYEQVVKEMKQPSKLLEHVAGRICNRLLQEFPAIEEVNLRLTKRNPPMGADITAAGVEVTVGR